MNEVDYIQGNKAAYSNILKFCIKQLDDNDYIEYEKAYINLLTERTEAILALRAVCSIISDNNWQDNLHLADIINKHILNYI